MSVRIAIPAKILHLVLTRVLGHLRLYRRSEFALDNGKKNTPALSDGRNAPMSQDGLNCTAVMVVSFSGLQSLNVASVNGILSSGVFGLGESPRSMHDVLGFHHSSGA